MELPQVFKHVSFLFVSLLFSFAVMASYAPVQMSGEIPWPLAEQAIVTVDNSQGLWRIGDDQSGYQYFNVEMVHRSETGIDWIRVSEMDASFKVLSWGEAYFHPSTNPGQLLPGYLGTTGLKSLNEQDHLGRYITMGANDPSVEPTSYLLRMVEVETAIGNVLGLSVFGFNAKDDATHTLGRRVMNRPMGCHLAGQESKLTCDLVVTNKTK